ncbi:MAG: DEAD/DEAH box helicase [Puniceicoccaceae bacterium]
MAHRDAHRLYSEQALEAWFEYLSDDWEPLFSSTVLDLARKLYRERRVRQIELTPDHAIIHCLFQEDHSAHAYSIIDWKKPRPSFRNSLTDKIDGPAIAAAGLYEIEELIADEIPPISRPPQPPNSTPQETSLPLTNGKNPSPETRETREAPPPSPSLRPPAQRLRLDFHWREGKLVCIPTRSNPSGPRTNAFDPLSPKVSPDLSGAHREQLIRLSALAKKSGFSFRSDQKKFYLEGSERFHPFLNGALQQWRSLFDVRLGPTVQEISNGIRPARVIAKVSPASTSRGLQLSWRVLVGDQWLSDDETLKLLRHKDSTVILKNRGAIRIDPDHLAAVERLQLPSNTSSAPSAIPVYLFYSLYRNASIEFEVAPEVEALYLQLQKPPTRPAYLPPFLRKYQADGVSWLLHLARSGCSPLLADDMGLGKTVQVLTFLSSLENPGQQPSIIICPASVTSVWVEEARRFFPHLRLEILSAANPFRSSDASAIWVTSFSQLRRHRNLLDSIEFHCAIIDEAQQIKNPEAKATRACYAIRALHRVALSGTPIENHLSDIWSIFRFLMPGLLGNQKDFLARLQGQGREKAIEELRVQLAPFMLRRTKQMVARELPPKIENISLCPLTDPQRRAYRELCDRAIAEFDKNGDFIAPERQIHFFSLLTRLRQACCDASLLPREFTQPTDLQPPSGKLEVLFSKLDEVLYGNRKIVVFSQFLPLLKRITQNLEERFPGIGIYTLTGQTKERASVIEGFQTTSSSAVMLVSLKAGGAGITLHAADYVFLMDPWWNPAVENQAIDRVHRIGQRRTVMVYRLVTEGTIEESIQLLKQQKAALFTSLLGSIESGTIRYQEHLSYLRTLLQNPGSVRPQAESNPAAPAPDPQQSSPSL